MDAPTRKLGQYVRDKGISIATLARNTNIPYVALYDSLAHEARDRDLRVGEYFAICKFLGIPAETFS